MITNCSLVHIAPLHAVSKASQHNLYNPYYSLHSFFMTFGLLMMISEGFGIFPIGKQRPCPHTPTSNQSVFLYRLHAKKVKC